MLFQALLVGINFLCNELGQKRTGAGIGVSVYVCREGGTLSGSIGANQGGCTGFFCVLYLDRLLEPMAAGPIRGTNPLWRRGAFDTGIAYQGLGGNKIAPAPSTCGV